MLQTPDGMTNTEFQAYVNIHCSLECFGLITDEEICASVVGDGEETDVSIVASETLPPPTSTEALSPLQTLRRYLEYSGCKDYKELYAVETRIESEIASKTEQTKLTDSFFHPINSLKCYVYPIYCFIE